MTKKMKRVTITLNIIYSLMVLLFLLDFFTSFDIKSQSLKSFAYFGFLIGTPTMLFWNLFSKIILLIVYPILSLSLIIAVNPFKIIYQKSAWETRAVFYKHNHKSCKTIELQWQDIGALGYNKREVEVAYVTPLFMIVKEVPPNVDKNSEWIENNSPIIIE